MNPNPQHIRYFIEACQQQSLIGAAQRFHVSPSAISQGIAKLEEALEVNLLVHAKKRFQLTPEGQKALPLLIEHIDSLNLLKSKLVSISDSKVEEVKVSTLRSIALAFFAETLTYIQRKRADINLVLNIGHTKDIVNQVQNQTVDIGVVVQNKKISGVKKISLHEGHFCLVVGRQFIKKTPYLDWLATQESPGGKELTTLLNQNIHSFAPNQKIQWIESWEVIAKLASSGLGIGLIPDFVYNSHPHLDLVKIPFAPVDKLSCEIVLISRKNLNSNTLKFFESQLKQQLQRG